jgi:crotonobetainyl-CoA:carnitine CoA-transferase CaiB-like acyl-CoA transferase
LLNELLAGAQVVVESFRPGVAQRLGLGVIEIQRHVPEIIYMSISGYGQNGPNRERPTVDGVIQAFSGMMVMNGSLSKPHRQSIVTIDIVTGLYGFQALSAAAAFQGVKPMEALVLASQHSRPRTAKHHPRGGSLPSGAVRSLR